MGSESRSCGTLWTMPATQKCARSTLFFPRNVVSRSFKQHQQCSGSRYQGVSRGAGAFFAERGTPLRARDASRFFVDFSRPAPEAGTVRDHRRKRPDSKKFPPAGLLTGGDSPPGPPPGNRPKNFHPPLRNFFVGKCMFFHPKMTPRKKFPLRGLLARGGSPPGPPLENGTKFFIPPAARAEPVPGTGAFLGGPSTALKFLTYYSTFLQHFYRLPP